MLPDILTNLPTANTLAAYLALGLFAMLEGPLSILVGGAAASSGLLLPVPVFISVVAGNLAADMGWYTLGRFGRVEWLERVCARFHVNRTHILQVQEGVRQYAPRLIFLSKLTVGFPIPTLVAAGLSRVPPRRWIAMLVLGELIKSAALVTTGYLFARMVSQASGVVQAVLWSLTAAAALGVLTWYRRRRSRLARLEAASRE